VLRRMHAERVRPDARTQQLLSELFTVVRSPTTFLGRSNLKNALKSDISLAPTLVRWVLALPPASQGLTRSSPPTVLFGMGYREPYIPQTMCRTFFAPQQELPLNMLNSLNLASLCPAIVWRFFSVDVFLRRFRYFNIEFSEIEVLPLFSPGSVVTR